MMLVALLVTSQAVFADDTWYLLGITNWNVDDSNKFNNQKIQKSLSAGNTYSFKVFRQRWEGDKYFGSDGTMDRTNCSSWGFDGSKGDCKITADVPGTYTFSISWNGDNPVISVSYPWGVYGDFDGSWKLWPINDGVANITGVTKGDHEYKIFTSKASSCNCSTCGKMTRSNCSGWQFHENNSNNACMNADIAGTYKFSWDNSTFKLSVTYPAFPLIKGSWDSWTNHDITNGTSITLSLTKSDTPYEFGVQSSSGNFYKNASITRGNCTNVSLSTDGSNATLAVDISGNYTFTWDATNYKVSVTYPTCPTPSLTSVTGDTNVKVGSEHTYTANGASAGTGATISSYDWTLPSGWTKKSSSSNTITVTVGNTTGSASISCKVTNSCGTQSAAKSLNVTVVPACTPPSSGFDAEGQLNAGQGSPWEGSKSDNATGGYFANNYRTITLTTDVDIDAYSWTCVTKPEDSTINWTNQTSKTATAQVNLPGVYTFKVAVNCTGGSSVESETVTVTVPYPEVGISGPLYNGSWNHGDAGNDGPKFTRNGLTYTNTFDINQKGEFVIIQRYKLGCTENNGWDGYQECSAISGDNGNKINNSTLTNEGGFANYGSGANFTTNLDVSGGSTVKITVTMTDYDSYRIKIEKKCDNPVITANPSTEAQTLCEGVDATQLSVTATGTDCTYQWYSYTNAGGTTGEASISGATSASYKPATTAAGTLYYRCKVTACETPVQSNVSGGITVNAGPGAVTKSPTDVHPYEVTTFTASGSGAASAEWSIQTRPSGVTADEAYLLGTTTGASVKFKGEAANGYVVRAAANGCNTDTQFNVVADPNNCQ